LLHLKGFATPESAASKKYSQSAASAAVAVARMAEEKLSH
jgi:hypothetical protein